MPYYESPYRSGKLRYYDPLKIREERGLVGLTDHVLGWMGLHSNEWRDKYDIFAMFPSLEQIDYNRLIYETQHPVSMLDIAWQIEGYPEAHCCWPYPCVLCAAIGCSVHWPWRAHFEKMLPYWQKEHSVP